MMVFAPPALVVVCTPRPRPRGHNCAAHGAASLVTPFLLVVECGMAIVPPIVPASSSNQQRPVRPFARAALAWQLLLHGGRRGVRGQWHFPAEWRWFAAACLRVGFELSPQLRSPSDSLAPRKTEGRESVQSPAIRRAINQSINRFKPRHENNERAIRSSIMQSIKQASKQSLVRGFLQ